MLKICSKYALKIYLYGRGTVGDKEAKGTVYVDMEER